MGFDSVFVSDHLQPWLHEGGHAPASIPWLGALGARTSRIVLIGTSVLTPTFRYHPTVIAQAFATLGVMYPGRVILGVGTGEALNEATLGLAWPEPPERFQRLKEAITLIERLWTEERVDLRRHLLHDPQRHDLRPARPAPVPIYIGAAGPAATRLAGRIADGFITTSRQGAEPLHRHAAARAARGAREGRPRRRRDRHAHGGEGLVPPRPRRRAGEDPVLGAARAAAPTRRWASTTRSRCSGSASELPIERAASRFIVSTDPDEHVEQIARYVDLGFRHLVFHDPGHDQEEFLRTYGAEILPRLRARFGASDGARDIGGPRGWAVIIPVKPSAVGKSRLDLPAVDRVTLARAIALDTIAAAAACAAVAQVFVVTDDGALVALAFDIPGLRFVPEGDAARASTRRSRPAPKRPASGCRAPRCSETFRRCGPTTSPRPSPPRRASTAASSPTPRAPARRS